MAKTLIDTIEVDAMVSEKPIRRMEITTHPVEQGADPADHSRVLPEELQLVGSITDYPISIADFNARGGYPGGGRSSGWSIQQRKALEALQDTHKVISVVTPRKTYTNMMLESFSWEATSRTGGELAFTAGFKAVKIVTNVGVALAQPPPPKTTTNQPNGTSQQPKQVAQPSNRATLLKTLLNSAGATTPGSGLSP
jgi:hypothetical protein